MPVAKSYTNKEILCEPYIKNKKSYVKIKTNSGPKEVRWYTEAEYAKMYSEDSSFGDPKSGRTRSYKEVLGFTNGYITIYGGNTYENIDWFREQPACRYSNLWGWYVSSEETIPENPPEDVITYILPFESIFVNENQIKKEADIKEAVSAILYSEKHGEYVGEIGDKVEAYLTVVSAIPMSSYYNENTNMYKFIDDLDNIYTWTTSAKTLTVGETYNIKGTIKDLKEYKGELTNVLTRCKILDF